MEAFHPGLCSERVAELVFEAIIKSKVKFESLDYVAALRYISMACTAEVVIRGEYYVSGDVIIMTGIEFFVQNNITS